MEQRRSEAQAIIDTVRELCGSTLVELPSGQKAVALPSGVKLQSIKGLMDEYRDRPERKEGTSAFTTIDDFCEYVNRHKQAASVVFLDDRNANDIKIVGIIDAHAGGKEEADWQKFRAVYSFPKSDEWKAWSGVVGKTFDQHDFAEFLEDRVVDIVDPGSAGQRAKELAEKLGIRFATAATMMETAKGLAVTVEHRLEHKVNPSTGETIFTYVEEHKDSSGKSFSPPAAFVVGIPVFKNAERLYAIPVRVRYRISNHKATWMLAPLGLDVFLEDALKDAAEVVKKATGLPLFRGASG